MPNDLNDGHIEQHGLVMSKHAHVRANLVRMSVNGLQGTFERVMTQ